MDRRLVVAAMVGGAAFDVAARSGSATIAATVWVGIVAAAILSGGRIRGISGRLLVSAAPVLALTLTVRSSPWITIPTAVAVGVLLLLGVSFAADGSGLSATFPALGGRILVVLGHLAVSLGMLRTRSGPALDGDAAPKRGAAVARGALLSLPVVLAVGFLLASADPIFRSWLDLAGGVQHLALALIGAWAVLGLSRAASASQPSPTLPTGPSLGSVEAACVLGGLCALYASFVTAQFVALSSGGRHVLATHGLTYAEYARSGFFQLLACAALTFVVLLSVRACANPAHAVLVSLSELTVALTIGVVVVAIRRLQLYEATYGLTMLRLASLVSAAWIGIVFVLLALTIPRRGLSRQWFPAAVMLSGLIVVGMWSISDPVSIVVQTNLRRAQHGQQFDVIQAASLGSDAVPTLVAGLQQLDTSQATELRQAICARSPDKATGTAFNFSRAEPTRR